MPLEIYLNDYEAKIAFTSLMAKLSRVFVISEKAHLMCSKHEKVV